MEAILQARLMFFKGRMEELIDVIPHVFEERGVVRFVFPAGRDCRRDAMARARRRRRRRRRRRIHEGMTEKSDDTVFNFKRRAIIMKMPLLGFYHISSDAPPVCSFRFLALHPERNDRFS